MSLATCTCDIVMEGFRTHLYTGTVSQGGHSWRGKGAGGSPKARKSSSSVMHLQEETAVHLFAQTNVALLNLHFYLLETDDNVWVLLLFSNPNKHQCFPSMNSELITLAVGVKLYHNALRELTVSLFFFFKVKQYMHKPHCDSEGTSPNSVKSRSFRSFACCVSKMKHHSAVFLHCYKGCYCQN